MRRVIGVVLRGRDLGRDFFPFRFITPGEYPRCREYRAPMISWIIRGFESFFPLFLLFPFPIFPPFVSSLRSLIFIRTNLVSIRIDTLNTYTFGRIFSAYQRRKQKSGAWER